MFPAIVAVQAEIHLHKRPPLGPFGLADEMQAGFERRVVGLLRVALDAGANDILPRRRAATVARNHVIQIQVLALKHQPAVLAGVFVALKNVVARELHFLLRQAVIGQKQNDARNANAKRNGVDGFVVRGALGKVAPLAEIKSAERTVVGVDDDLGVPLKKQRKGAPGGANIHSLPQPVQH